MLCRSTSRADLGRDQLEQEGALPAPSINVLPEFIGLLLHFDLPGFLKPAMVLAYIQEPKWY